MGATDTVSFIVLDGKTKVESWAVQVGDTVEALAEVPAKPTVTLTLSSADAAAYRAGEFDLSVGFMRGSMKMSGDFGALFRVLPKLRTL